MTTKTELKQLSKEFGDLLDTHGGRRLSEFKKYENDPIGFIRDVLKANLWSRQEEIALDLVRHPLVAVKSGNGLGKDFLASHLALWWAYCRRGLVLITGPTQHQTRDIIMKEVALAWGRAKDLPGELYQMALRISGDDKAGIRTFVSNEISRMTGHHSDRILVIITEGQGCPDFAYQAGFRCAVGAEDRFLVVGNPNTRSCQFAQLFDSDVWSQHSISCFEAPTITDGVHYPGMITAAGIARIEQEYGKGSGVYAAAVLGEFPSEDSEALIRRHWLEDSAARWDKGSPSDVEPVVSIDPARYGRDQTCVAVIRGSRLESLKLWGSVDLMETVEKVIEVCNEARCFPERYDRAGRGWPAHGRVVCDAIGVGGGVADRLRQMRYNLADFKASQAATTRAKFLNRRAQSYWQLRERLEAGTVDLPWDEKLVDELTSLRYFQTAAGKIALESKDDLKARIGRSCDRSDSVSMGFGCMDREAVVVGLYSVLRGEA